MGLSIAPCCLNVRAEAYPKCPQKSRQTSCNIIKNGFRCINIILNFEQLLYSPGKNLFNKYLMFKKCVHI